MQRPDSLSQQYQKSFDQLPEQSQLVINEWPSLRVEESKRVLPLSRLCVNH